MQTWLIECLEDQPTLSDADVDEVLKMALSAVQLQQTAPHNVRTEFKLYKLAGRLRKRLDIAATPLQ